jgi:hypothetical protein
LDGMPRACRSSGSQLDISSVIAALRKRLGVVCPENSNFNGWLKEVGSLLSDSNLAVGTMSLLMSVDWIEYWESAGRCLELRTGTGLLKCRDKSYMQNLVSFFHSPCVFRSCKSNLAVVTY